MTAMEAARRTILAPRKLPPELIILAGCLIGVLTFGPRSAVGVFQLPILQERGWGSDIFSFAMAAQYLLWGAGQPFAGAHGQFCPVQQLGVAEGQMNIFQVKQRGHSVGL